MKLWKLVLFVAVAGFLLAGIASIVLAETYEKVDNTLKVVDSEVIMTIDDKNVRAIIPELTFTCDQLKDLEKKAQNRYDRFVQRTSQLLIELNKVKALIVEADKLGIK